MLRNTINESLWCEVISPLATIDIDFTDKKAVERLIEQERLSHLIDSFGFPGFKGSNRAKTLAYYRDQTDQEHPYRPANGIRLWYSENPGEKKILFTTGQSIASACEDGPYYLEQIVYLAATLAEFNPKIHGHGKVRFLLVQEIEKIDSTKIVLMGADITHRDEDHVFHGKSNTLLEISPQKVNPPLPEIVKAPLPISRRRAKDNSLNWYEKWKEWAASLFRGNIPQP